MYFYTNLCFSSGYIYLVASPNNRTAFSRRSTRWARNTISDSISSPGLVGVCWTWVTNKCSIIDFSSTGRGRWLSSITVISSITFCGKTKHNFMKLPSSSYLFYGYDVFSSILCGTMSTLGKTMAG